MYIRMKGGKPFAFAGLWDRWRSPGGEELLSCTIVTGPPNTLCEEIHNRMPVILSGEDCKSWVKPEEMSAEQAAALLKSYPPEEMEAFPVSRRVNNPAADVPDCIEPNEEPTEAPERKKSSRRKNDQPSLF